MYTGSASNSLARRDMCILFFSIQTTNLMKLGTKSGMLFLVIQTKNPTLLWADLQKLGYTVSTFAFGKK
jgi:hypothetical protein